MLAQFTHGTSSFIDGMPDLAVGDGFANADIHNVLNPLFGQNQLAVAGAPQTVMLALVLDKRFIARKKQAVAGNWARSVQHHVGVLDALGDRNHAWFFHIFSLDQLLMRMIRNYIYFFAKCKA